MSKKKPLPPTYFMTSLILEIGLHFVVPINQLYRTPYRYLGIIPIIFGIVLNLWTDNLFKKKETTVKPFEKPSAFIKNGPFRISRHPMYLGMVAILLGGAFVLGSITAFIFPVLFFIAMEIVFIRHEEISLEETFGQTYLDYKKTVRRWI